MTYLPKRARTFVLAVSTAAAVLGISAMSVGAEPVGPADPGVRCAAKVGPGQYEFYLPGERATDVNGNKWVCGPDGQWFRDYSALIRFQTTTSVITKATAVFAP